MGFDVTAALERSFTFPQTVILTDAKRVAGSASRFSHNLLHLTHHRSS